MKKLSRFKIDKLDLFYCGIIFSIVLIVFLLNVKSNTWLMGWDNLMQEMSIKINAERHLTSVWQEYQGLGLQSGISYGADLPRFLIISLLSLIFPANQIRYLYMFICLLVGSIGIYHLLKWTLQPLRNWKDFCEEKHIKFLAFSGFIFYLFNLGTIQVFYAPIETFPTQWAYLPWLFLYFFKILKENKKINYLIFAIINILAMPMAQVPTTFLMYFCIILLFGVINIIGSFRKKELMISASRFTKAVILTLLINSLWLLPFLFYNLSGKASTVSESTVNQAFSEDIYYRNTARGKIQDVMLLKGFLYDTYDRYNISNTFEPMMKNWVNYYSSGSTEIIGYLFFGIIIIGIAFSFSKKISFRLCFIFLFIFVIFFLSASNPPFGRLFDNLRDSFKLFKEALRFPYTKIVQLAIIAFSYFFTLGIAALFYLAKRILKVNLLEVLGSGIFLATFIYIFPIFTGNLFFNEIKVQIPPEYFQMFKWFENQDPTLRIANIPQSTINNWNYYDWGYRGGGFIWYGLKQPVMDRNFDNWNFSNEQYFREIRSAIYSLDLIQLKNILTKYNIGWLVYDKHLLFNQDVTKKGNEFYNDKFIPNLLEDKDFKELAKFEDNIVVFGYQPNLDNSKSINVLNNYKIVDNEFKKRFSENDSLLNQNYINKGVLGERFIISDLNEFEKKIRFDNNIIKTDLSLNIDNDTSIVIPEYWNKEDSGLLNVYLRDDQGAYKTLELELVVPSIKINNEKVYPKKNPSITYKLLKGVYYLRSNLDTLYIDTNSSGKIGNIIIKKNEQLQLFSFNEFKFENLNKKFSKSKNCDSKEKENYEYTKTDTSDTIYLSTQNAINCIETPLNKPTGFILSKIEFTYQSDTNNYPNICLLDSNNKCISEIIPTSLRTAIKQYQKFENYYLLHSNDKYSLKLSLYDTQYIKGLQKLNIKDIKISYYSIFDLISTKSINIQRESIPMGVNQNTISIEYPIINALSVGDHIKAKDINSLPAISCTNKGVNPAVQIIKKEGLQDGGEQFTTQNGENCFIAWNRNELPMDSNYLLSLNTKNIAGYPFEASISNSSFTTDKYLLYNSVNNRFIPKFNSIGNGLSISLNNLSRGESKSQNIFYDLSVQFYPLDLVQNIFLSKSNSSDISSTLKINSFSRINPFTYSLNLNGEGIIDLKQSFSKGWVLINTDNISFNLNNLLINNWSNGWELK